MHQVRAAASAEDEGEASHSLSSSEKEGEKEELYIHTHMGWGNVAKPKRAQGNGEEPLTGSRRSSQGKDFQEKYTAGVLHFK